MTERLAWLFKIILLKELGFSPNHIHELTARNVSFNYAKLQAQDHSELRP